METQAISPEKPEKLQTNIEQTSNTLSVEASQDKIYIEKAEQSQKDHGNTHGQVEAQTIRIFYFYIRSKTTKNRQMKKQIAIVEYTEKQESIELLIYGVEAINLGRGTACSSRR